MIKYIDLLIPLSAAILFTFFPHILVKDSAIDCLEKRKRLKRAGYLGFIATVFIAAAKYMAFDIK